MVRSRHRIKLAIFLALVSAVTIVAAVVDENDSYQQQHTFVEKGGFVQHSRNLASATAGADSRLIAYLGNWEPCPTSAQTNQYSHIFIAFAVTTCTSTCTIGSPVAICNNAVNPTLVSTWQAAGKKVILSFGGASMGGSWGSDPNGCWDACVGKESSVVTQLVNIVNNQKFDGVDIDYEYFYNTAARQKFIKDITTGLRANLPTGSILTHAPMDSDMVPGSAYYEILKSISSSLSFLNVQYYNGINNPVKDGFSVATYSHYKNLVDNIFLGDVTKVVLGFCVTECAEWNANSQQAVKILNDLKSSYPCNGGAFFWDGKDDPSGSWSTGVAAVVQPSAGCSKAPAPAPKPIPVPSPQSTSCSTIEENTDYTKSDICTTCPASSTAEGCCSICAKTVGCGAYTWTNFNGGTCWLKSSKIGAIACTGCRSATIKSPAPIPVPAPAPITLPVPAPKPVPVPSPQSSSCSTIEENTDYTKSDICTTCPASATAEGCCSICAKTVGCGAYTWTNFNGGTCWLKSSKIGAIACTGCRSATIKSPAPIPVPAPAPITLPIPAPKPVPVPSPQSFSCSAIEENIDYTKSDICTTCPASATAEGCCSICAKTVGCGAYTWTNFNGGTCWLKSSKIGAIACTGCRSATMKSSAPIPVPAPAPITLPVPAPKPVPVPSPQTSSCSTIEENTDYTKSDICTTCPASSTAEGCCSICAKTVGCGAYTWTNFNGGTCWLKSSKIGAIACTGCRSATMKSSAPIPVPAPAPITLPVPAGGTLISQWQTCRKNIDWCDPSWTCCVAPADVGTGKATCRPVCCGNCADTSTSTFKTLNLLNRVSGSQVVSGQHNDGKKGIDWAWYTNKVKEKTGKYPGLYSADFVWGTDHSFAVQEAIRQWNAGAIINFMWHQCPPRPGFSSSTCQWEGTSANSYAILSTLTDAEWNSLITDGSSWNVEYKNRMDFIAGYLKTLKSNGVEVLFRPLHEMNQGRFWWGGRTGASGTRRLYQITRDYMVNTHGLNNLIWVWNVQDLSSNYWEYNPGSNYFDVASLDIYSNGYWDDQFYQALLNEAGNKPVGIGESFEVPSVSYLNGHTRLSFFMVWADEGFFADNYSRSQTLADVQATYGSSRVLTRENLNRG